MMFEVTFSDGAAYIVNLHITGSVWGRNNLVFSGADFLITIYDNEWDRFPRLTFLI